VTVFCHDCGHERKVVISCGDRACPKCREKEFYRLKKKYSPALSLLDSKKLVFITLTRKIDGRSLRAKIDETKEAWKKLIRLDGMEAVRGGFYTIEIKYSEKWHGWNVHIHAVAEIDEKARVRVWEDRVSGRLKADVIYRAGQHVSIQFLRSEWKRLTGDSDRVDMAPVLEKKGGVRGVMSYILKYLKKPAEVDGREDEYNRALKGRRAVKDEEGNVITKGLGTIRLVSAWGTWYPTSKDYRFAGIDLTKEPMKCDCGHTVWLSEFELFKLIKNAVEGFIPVPESPPSPPLPPWFVQGYLDLEKVC